MLKPHEIETYRQLETMLKMHRQCCLIADTGVGKSRISSHFVESYKLNALIISHRKSINSEWESWNSPYISTTTTQNFYKHYEDFTTGFDIYIFDECQYLGAPKWGKAYNAFKLLISENAYILGLTATPHRYEYNIVENIAEKAFGNHIVYGIEKEEAIRLGVIHRSSYVYALYDTGELITKYSEKDMTDELRGSLDTFRNMPQIKDILIKHAPKDTPKKGIVYMHDIDSIEEGEIIVRETFPDEPIWSIHSKMPSNETNRYREEFKKSERGFLVNVDMASEGLHYIGVNMIIMLSKTSSPNKFKQRVGRGSNTPGCVVFDLVGSFVSVRKTLNRIGKDIAGFTKISSGFGFEEFVSDQEIIYDYVTDLFMLLQEIDDYNDTTVWTPEEDKILKDNYPTIGSDVYKLLPGRTKSACYTRAEFFGIVRYSRWTPGEIQILKDNYHTMGGDVYKLLPGRTSRTCVAKAMKIGLRIVHPWTLEEDKILKDNYPTMGTDVYKLLPGRTKGACANRARELRLYINKSWTPEEDKILKDNYPTMGSDVYKLLTGKDRNKCRARAIKLQIKYIDTHKWTPEEDKILIENYPTMGAEVSELLEGRTASTCMQRACKLNVSVIDKPDQWTPEEIQILKDNYLTMGKDVYKLLPGRTSTTCAAKANSIGINFFINKDWTPEEDEILINNYPTMGKDVYKLLPGRTKGACANRANNKFKLKCDNRKRQARPTDWTPEEDKILMDNYHTMGKKICDLLLKRSYKACISRFHVLNKK